MRQNASMESKANTFRNVMGYALFLLYGVGGLITIGLFVFGYRDAAGIALLCLLAGSAISLFVPMLVRVSMKCQRRSKSAPKWLLIALFGRILKSCLILRYKK